MPIQINQPPAHDFDEPLGMLSDCHRRIEHFLRLLVVVDDEAAGGPLTPAHRRALEAALSYFAVAGKRHTDDEEGSLFPRLRESADPEATRACELIDRLGHDHAEADTHHAAVDSLARDWLAHDALTPSRAAELRQHLRRLQALYAEHIAVEDRELFPAAARLLDAGQIREIGREMAARRQL